MNTQEKKQQIFADVKKKYSHLTNYCTIDAQGLGDESPYFHPRFVINEDVYISAQCDTKTIYPYAFRVNFKTDDVSQCVEIYDGLLDNVIIGWHANKEKVLLAISTLHKVKNHINNLNNYANDYIIQILVGNSLGELTTAFINEFKATQSLIDYIDNNKN
jgi:hypothetical protein